MKSRNFLLHSFALELARISEMLRQRDPKTAEAGEALLGIRRQLAAASVLDPAAEKNEVDANGDPTEKGSASNDVSPRMKADRKSRLHQKQLLEQLISDAERLTLMLVSEQAASEAASETFAEFRQAVIAKASERRKHLTDLSYLHSLSIGTSDTQPIVAELEDMFRRAGGTIVSDYSEERKADFDVAGSGSHMTVLRPAYIATNSDGRTMLVARGKAEMRAAENATETSTASGADAK